MVNSSSDAFASSQITFTVAETTAKTKVRLNAVILLI